MYTECQKCGYQFVKSESKTINNTEKKKYINDYLLEFRQKGKLQNISHAEKW